MKRNIILSLAALALAAGCSKTVVNAPETEEAWVYDESLPVPVAFAAPGLDMTLTKAEVAGTIEGSVMNGLDIGVFGLAYDVDGKTPAWDSSDRSTILLDNKKVTTGEDGSVKFEPAVYYPTDNDLNYSFYAYYPHRPYQLSENRYSVEYALGYTDVLWAEEHANIAGEYKGFNAKYCRQMKLVGRDDLLPALEFKHMLTAFRFVAKSSTDLDNLVVRSLTVKNTYTKVSLEVAGPDAGNLTFSEPGDRYLLKTPGDYNTGTLDVAPTAAGAELGTLILGDTEGEIEVEVVLSLDNGTRNTVTASLRGSFAAGHRYVLTLTVRSPEEVDLSTSLDPWIDENGGAGSTIG